ncbi:uncharacterized protein LOC127586267 [Pristis pectinata]|uniref:uncharacterized protein LOC127586267 n=1 Tax=Pristis pectinata TaxID=685728 RepID=UPI00223D7AED|nr:uncharacterized protein LOC127586267 [Pristis pectinata]
MELPRAHVQYLKSLGIKVKHFKLDTDKSSSSGLVFGNSLQALPQYRLPDGSGTIPRFLMEACSFLSQYIETEGIFRKSGSAFRMKNLKAKLQQGDCSLELSSTSDVAGLLKQFFRELPEPIVPAGFHGPLCQAQRLQTEDERSAVTLLLTCLMPRPNVTTMKYFLSFLQTVAGRSEKNKMGVRNLAVVFTPNLFQLFDANGKLAGNVAEVLPLLTQAAETLITQAQSIGHLPPFVLDKLPILLDTEAGSVTSGDPGGQRLLVKQRKRLWHSVGVIVSGALSRLKTSITPQPDKSTVSHQQETSPVVEATLTSKRKAADNSARISGITPKKRRSVTDSMDVEPEPRVDSGSPGAEDLPPADFSQDEDLFSAASSSPSAFLKPMKEGDILSAGGRRIPSTSSATRMGSRKAGSNGEQRVPLKKAGTPRTVDHWERVEESPQCLGLAGSEDSKFNPPLDLSCCDWMAPISCGGLDGTPSPGTSVLSTPVTQDNGPQGGDLSCRSEWEDPASPLSPCLVSNTLSGAKLSMGEAAFLEDTSCPITSPSDPVLRAKDPPHMPRKVLMPSITDSPERAGKDRLWKGCRDAMRLDFSPSGDYDVSLPHFLQCGSILNCKVVRRSLSLPEDISENWECGVGEAEMAAGPEVQLKALGSTSPVAGTENSQTFSSGHTQQPISNTGAYHHATDLVGYVGDMMAGPHVSEGLATPIITHMENCASNSLYDTEAELRSAKSCKPVPHDPMSYTSEKSHPQPSIMELARSSVTEYIRKFNKLSVKRGGLKHKCPVSSKQTPQQRSVLRFAQQASTLFRRKPEGRKQQGTRQPMRRSLSLESALEMCRDLEELKGDLTTKQGVIVASESNKPPCSGASEQCRFIGDVANSERDIQAESRRRPPLRNRETPISPEVSRGRVESHHPGNRYPAMHMY